MPLSGLTLSAKLFLHQLVDLGETLDIGLEIFLRTAGGRGNTGHARPKHTTQDGAQNDDESGEKDRTVTNAASTPRTSV